MMRTASTLLVLLAASAMAQTRQVRVRIDTDEQADTFSALHLDHATCSCGRAHAGETVDVFIHDATEEDALNDAGFSPVLVHADTEAFYRSRLTSFGARSGPPTFAQGSMGGYFTFMEMILYMDALQAQYPQLMAPKVSLGSSIEGRDLWMWKISDNPGQDENEPEVLIDALHHAREPGTTMTACWLATQLLQSYGSDPTLTELVNEREIFIVPVTNPDGFVWNQTTDPNGGGLWRKNRRANAGGSLGVDLNRNYGYLWGYDNSGSSPTPSSPTYRGTGPFSEPETTAVKTFAEGRNLNAYFSMHAHGGMFFIPPAHENGTFAPPPYDQQYAAIAAGTTALGVGYATGTVWQLLYTANGGSMDWFYGGLYGGQQCWAFGCELGTSQDGFWPATNRIVPIANDGVLFCRYIIERAGPALASDNLAVMDTGGTVPGTWEAGESLSITFDLANDGTQDASVTIAVLTQSPWLQVNSAPISVGVVPAFGSTSTSATPLLVSVSPNAPSGATVSLDVVATALGATTLRTTITRVVDAQPVTAADHDFESPAGWTVGLPGDTAVAGVWTRTDPNGTTSQGQAFNPEDDHTPSGTQCWFTGQGSVGGPAGAQDVDGITTLVSPVFDLSNVALPEINYWRWFATSATDTLEIGLSNDGGASWTVIETLSSTQSQWNEITVQVASWLPPTDAVQMYFRAADSPNNSLCEAAIDDFRITGIQPVASINVTGSGTIGSTVAVALSAPSYGGATYYLGAALTAQTGFLLPPAGRVPLDLDPLFFAVPLLPQVFSGFVGTLSGLGGGSGQILVPNDPSLSGLGLYVAGAVVDLGIPAAVTGGVRIVVP